MKLTDRTFKVIPIIVERTENGYAAMLPDNYENFKTSKFSNINFEDLAFHLGICAYSFGSKTDARKAAVEAKALLDNKGLKCKVWYST